MSSSKYVTRAFNGYRSLEKISLPLVVSCAASQPIRSVGAVREFVAAQGHV